MSRFKTVGDLREELENYPDEMQIMCVHQPNWPLREVIGGLWLDDGGIYDDEEENTCESCGCLLLGEPFEKEGEWFRKCYGCEEMQPSEEPVKEEDKVLYIVLNGHPYDGTPYGSKRAWNEI